MNKIFSINWKHSKNQGFDSVVRKSQDRTIIEVSEKIKIFETIVYFSLNENKKRT